VPLRFYVCYLFVRFKAFVAIDRFVCFGSERNDGFLVAIRAHGYKRLSVLVESASFVVAAFFAAQRLILKPSFCEKFLFSCGENEILPAVLAC